MTLVCLSSSAAATMRLASVWLDDDHHHDHHEFISTCRPCRSFNVHLVAGKAAISASCGATKSGRTSEVTCAAH